MLAAISRYDHDVASLASEIHNSTSPREFVDTKSSIHSRDSAELGVLDILPAYTEITDEFRIADKPGVSFSIDDFRLYLRIV